MSAPKCPTCHRPMTRFEPNGVEEYRCMNVSAPEHNQSVNEGRKGKPKHKPGQDPRGRRRGSF